VPKLSPASFILTSALCAACASSNPEPSEPVTADVPPAPSADPATTAAPSAAPSAAASAGPADKPAGDHVPEPPFKGESPGNGKKIGSKRAWAYWPDYGGIGVFDVKESTDAKTTFLEFASSSATFTIPSAFARDVAAPKQLAKGDLVLATVVTKGVCAVVKDIKDDKVNVGFVWGQKPDEREFLKEELLRLSDKLELGTRVVWKQNDAWTAGALVHTDKATAWVAPFEIGQDEAKAPLADVRALDVGKRRKKGDKVIACTFDTMGCIETTVIGPKHDGVAYEIALPADYVGPAGDGAKSMVASACSIGSIPKK